MSEHIISGKWTEQEIDRLLNQSSKLTCPGDRINFISHKFLNIQYKENTLSGSINSPEALIINLEGVDCFTFIDYIEAMRISDSFRLFRGNLIKVRYCTGIVAFKNRNHFFSDWRECNTDLVEDVTDYISTGKSITVTKSLNKKEDGTLYLQGIPVTERDITFIPSGDVYDAVVDKLNTGDYAGIYSKKQGLDISHVGILIKRENSIYFRHASSAGHYKKVIDEDFRLYIADKPGIVVLRPKTGIINAY
jgi:hypothetical protein